MSDIYNENLLDEIVAGDQVCSSGDRHIARITGTVVKANRVNLTLDTDYMGNPMQLKVRRDDLRGQVRLFRNGQMFTNQQPRELTPCND